MQIFAGTSGFSYKEWKGDFYPEKLPDKQMLSYYGEQLTAVEINNTFYRMPRASVLENWSDQVPDGFRFVIKASRKITHFKRLKDAGDEMEYLLRTTETLGKKLGAILYQLPANLKKDVERLEDFLNLLPAGSRGAFEFRHESWFDDEVQQLLSQHKCSLVMADTDDEPIETITETAPWGYLRLRRQNYTADDLAEWKARLAATQWNDVYVFFKHEDAAGGPAVAKQFLDMR